MKKRNKKINIYNLPPVEDIWEEIRTNIRILNNKLTICIYFLKGNNRKKTEVYPQALQNNESNAKTPALNSPDKLVLPGIQNRTARTPRRKRTPPRRQESSYTSMILNFLEKLPKTGFDATRQPWRARCAMRLCAKNRGSCVCRAQRHD